MINHYVNGKKVDDISGYVIRREEAETLYQMIERRRNEKKSNSQQDIKNNNVYCRNHCNSFDLLS